MASSRAAHLALVSALLCGAALAQTRPIPDDVKRGYMRHVGGMAVTVDNEPMRLAVGAQIRSPQNLIIVPVSFPRAGAWVDYTLDRNGDIFRVWLLTAKELERRKPGGGN